VIEVRDAGVRRRLCFNRKDLVVDPRATVIGNLRAAVSEGRADETCQRITK
jgi:hypothetical protein